MIYEVSGDILLSRAPAVAHGVGPSDHFDHGLALALRQRYPAMARDFRHYAHQCHPKPGELWEWGGPGGVRVFNLITQNGGHGPEDRPGPATAAAVNHCLRRLRHTVEAEGVKGLALPRLATGVGGLAWEEVEPLVAAHLGTLAIPVYVYTTYHPSVQAVEPGA